MRVFNNYKIIGYVSAFFLLSGCKKEIKNEYIYELQEVKIKQASANKNAAKTDLEFISLVYSDLFGKNIGQDDLTKLITTYNSFGDKGLIVDMVIRDFLNRSEVKIPTQQEMQAAPEKFVSDTYKKFFVREPGEYEKYYLTDQIKKNPNLTPRLIYYTFLTSNEYKYY